MEVMLVGIDEGEVSKGVVNFYVVTDCIFFEEVDDNGMVDEVT